MAKKRYDISKSDAQATVVDSIKVSDFCFDTYQEYNQTLTENCVKFMQSDAGVLVYRRMRVAEVFSYGCSDMKKSLEWQLGALQESMLYKADVPNFLEPWYGIGVIGAAFGLEYIWHPGLAPATKPVFQTIDEALEFDFNAVKDTEIGKHSLEMIEYFLDQTKGKLPMSMGDIQSPLNNATNIIDSGNFFMSLLMEPEKVMKILNMFADLEIDFYKEQEKLIGDTLVKPGHGFASSHVFEGFGMSDDNVVMVDEDSYMNYISPSFEKLGQAFGGPVFHSCGNYSVKAGMLNKIKGLKMTDGAFTIETDPDPNPAAPFAESLNNSGIILNARVLGEPEEVQTITKELWKPGMKVILVTYSQTPDEQKQVYDMIKGICN